MAGGATALAVPLAIHAVWPVIRPAVRGYQGEAKVKRILREFNGEDFAQEHDLLIPGGRDTTQIDHVLISRYGIFVIETKNYSGIVAGAEDDARWTQITSIGFKRKFLNPLLQNKTHVNALKALLSSQYPDIPFHSIVAFSDDCTPPPIPGIVRLNDLKLAIEVRCSGKPVLSQEDVQNISNTLSDAKITGRRARKLHDAKARLAADAAEHVTPEMLEELAAKGETAPTLYFGEKRKPRAMSARQFQLTEAGAKLTINGKTASIEDFFEDAKRDYSGQPVPKGAPFDHFICPFTGDGFPPSEAKSLYEGLWVAYLTKKPELVSYLQDHADDKNLGGTFRCQRVLSAYARDPEGFAQQARDNDWYWNIAQKRQPRCRPLNEQIQTAEKAVKQPVPNKTYSKPIDR